MTDVFYTNTALFFWILFFLAFAKDRSRYRNCFLLFFALLSSIAALSFLAGDHQKEAIMTFAYITLFTILFVPLILVSNGLIMLKREGRSLSTILSLAFGLLIGFGELATFIVVLIPNLRGYDPQFEKAADGIGYASILISVSVIYISMLFVIFMIYSLFLQIIPHKKDFDYLIIHGAGLLDGRRVSKLLADRLDKAILVYRKDPTPPILIPSGGKGSDEAISEAEAMAEYLIAKGIPEDKIIKEDQSATTFENLKNSKAIIDSMAGSRYTALVTSNYHVYRALRYCRAVGLDSTGIGSHVALYYWPSALIREFIAVHAEKKHLLLLAAGWILCILPVVFDMMAQ